MAQESLKIDSGLAYWKQQLVGSPPVLALPTVGRRPAVQSLQGARHRFALSAELSEALRALSCQEGVTLFMTLLAAFQTLLARYTSQEDIWVGTPVQSPQVETEGPIGFSGNMLVLRTDLAGNPRFRALLGRVREVVQGAYAHQDLPFKTLMEALQPEWNLSHSPLFQVMFALQNGARQALELSSLSMIPLEGDSGTALFDLNLEIIEGAAGLSCVFEYNSGLFNAPTIMRMSGHFQILLEGIVANPAQRIGTLPLLTDAERHQLLIEWNDTNRDYPQDKCLHQLFEAQVERMPDAPALVFEDEQLTYRELNARANQLAHYLRALGVGPEVLVGICMERSLEMIVGVLGILKAGGAYVPLDPAYPQERLAFMLVDSQAPVVVTQERLVEKLPEQGAKVVCLDTEWEAIARESKENPVSGAIADNLAYVIYTSGSTGKPKGVLVSHYNITRLFEATESWFRFNERDVWTLFHSVAFDFSVWELWGALLYGGRLVVVPYWLSRSPEAFYDLLYTEQVTVLNQTPSAFRQLISCEGTLGTARELTLRLIIFGGEALDLQSLTPWFDRHGDQCPQLVNMYGITETTVHVTYRPLSAADVRRIAGSVIGGPIPDLQVYVLDQHLEPVPIGVSGEMYVSGAGVARGYLNHAELTAERFIPNPFASEVGTRLYKTGDLARYRPDGDLEYLGRIDHQVKIRGFRIELGEIEAVLGQHPGVQETVVIAHEHSPGDQRLGAYVVPRPGVTLTAKQLQSFLQQTLPVYMVPSTFVILHALPLTPNGKIDRQALPAPHSDRLDLDVPFVAPRLPVEQRIADIWAHILKVRGVGIHDNFFTLGGHSLLATQVISRVNEAFQVVMPLHSLFENPTVADLTVAVAQRKAEQVARDKIIRLLAEVEHLSTDEIRARLTAKNTEEKVGRRDLCQHIAELSPEQREQLMQQLDQAERVAIPSHLRLEKRRDGDALPLSFAQQRLWVLDQLQPGNPAYNIPVSYRLIGGLHVSALAQSLNEIVQRHEILRTTFPAVDGQPVQVVSPYQTVTLRLVALQGCPVIMREAEVQRLATEEAQRPFDLGQGPLLRVTLLRVGEEEHVLLLLMHHIISDGWSLGLFWRELSALYDAFATGKPSPLPELPIQYADFAVWQRQWLQGEILETQLAYWKGQLAYAPPTLELSTDYAPPPVQTFRGGTHSFELSQTLTEALKALSRQEGVTLFMTLLAAFQLLLYRYTGQDDILVGSPVAGRNRTETEGLIGCFVQTLVLRTDLAGNPSCRELLRRVREVALGAYAHQDLPFEQLVEELQPARDLSRNPLFQVMLVLQNVPTSVVVLPGLTVSPVEVESGTAKFDLSLGLREELERLSGGFEYNSDLFESSTIARMATHFQTLLESLVTHPDQRLSDVALLTDAERQQLLVEWNDTRADYPHDMCIHRLFELQAEQTPDAVAVVSPDASLTYRELNHCANQLAHHLQALGVGLDARVGLYTERSLEMVIGLLSILKAGGAYVPLAPAYPAERIAYIMQDAQVSVLLTQRHLLPTLPQHSTHVVCLDTEWEAIARQSGDNLVNEVSAEHPAYVIYTSGSTGRPKGVLGLHRGAVNRFHWMWHTYPFTAGEICCQKTSLSFVDSVWEIFGPLLQGIRVVIIPDAVVQDPYRLVQTCATQHITRIVLVPSLLQTIIDTHPALQSQLPHLKYWISSGEALPLRLCQRFLAAMPQGILLNLYGASEVAADVTWYDTGQSQSLACVPIGRPLANTQLYLLDRHLQPVPIGVRGEIYVGGAGLAQGYLNNPALTAEKFIPHPFSSAAGARLYKTGDLARYLPDGTVEFLGRLDHQVKMRGFRIELGEIEAVLSQHPAVRAALALVREDVCGDKRLVAYVTSAQASEPNSDELRRFLQAKLPEYMMPSAFIRLDTLPRTPHGKIDRAALPAPDGERPDLDNTFVAPRDQLELQLTKIWEKILGFRPIGIRDNFFALGGHSLLAVRLVAQIEQMTGRDLSLSGLFQAPTVAQLAALLRQEGWSTPWLLLVPIQPGGSKPPLFCVHGGSGLAHYLGTDQPYYGLQPHGLDGRRVPTTVEAMAVDYLKEIRTLQPEGPYCLGGYSYGGVVAFEMAQQLCQQGQKVALLVLLDPITPRMSTVSSVTSSDSPPLLPALTRCRAALSRHVGNLRPLGSQERMVYLLNAVRGRWQWVESNIKRGVCKLWLGMGCRVPPMLRRFYFLEFGIQAARGYAPYGYPGRVLLFKAAQRADAPQLRWGKLAGGGLDIHEIPGGHDAILCDPQVQEIVATHLTDYLRQACGVADERGGFTRDV